MGARAPLPRVRTMRRCQRSSVLFKLLQRYDRPAVEVVRVAQGARDRPV